MRPIIRNAWASTLQAAISGILMFFLYRSLLDSIGVDGMGVWSVILATTSSARITELGLSGSVVKFVAKYLALDSKLIASNLIQTATISLGSFIGVILVGIYFPLQWLLPYFLPATAIHEAASLLPFALGSLWLTTLTGVAQAALDGCQRTDLRGLASVLNNLLMLVLATWLAPLYGLTGLAYSQIITAGLLLITTWLLLRSQLKQLPILPYSWNLSLFREMVLYGLSFQATSVAAMLFDPVTKLLLSSYGNLSLVGYYEMSSRMIGQLRGLMIAAQQVLVPVIADSQEKKPEKVLEIYKDIYQAQVYISIPFYLGIAALTPVISILWIGYYENDFVCFTLLLTLGWFLNGFIAPAYFVNLGIGELRWNMISHLVIGAGNAGLGILFGMHLGGYGVIIAWVVSLALGSLIVVLAFHINHKINLQELIPPGSIELIFACGFGTWVCWLAYHYLPSGMDKLWIAIACLVIYSASIAISVWRHPLRSRLLLLMAGR